MKNYLAEAKSCFFFLLSLSLKTWLLRDALPWQPRKCRRSVSFFLFFVAELRRSILSCSHGCWTLARCESCDLSLRYSSLLRAQTLTADKLSRSNQTSVSDELDEFEVLDLSSFCLGSLVVSYLVVWRLCADSWLCSIFYFNSAYFHWINKMNFYNYSCRITAVALRVGYHVSNTTSKSGSWNQGLMCFQYGWLHYGKERIYCNIHKGTYSINLEQK